MEFWVILKAESLSNSDRAAGWDPGFAGGPPIVLCKLRFIYRYPEECCHGDRHAGR
jgi:hypothetical protein